jgi:hypothetical protein
MASLPLAWLASSRDKAGKEMVRFSTDTDVPDNPPPSPKDGAVQQTKKNTVIDLTVDDKPDDRDAMERAIAMSLEDQPVRRFVSPLSSSSTGHAGGRGLAGRPQSRDERKHARCAGCGLAGRRLS